MPLHRPWLYSSCLAVCMCHLESTLSLVAAPFTRCGENVCTNHKLTSIFRAMLPLKLSRYHCISHSKRQISQYFLLWLSTE